MRLNDVPATMVALDSKSISLASVEAWHRKLMEARYDELEWEFKGTEFDDWYRNSRYAAKAVCESIGRSRVGERFYEEIRKKT